MRVTTAPGSVDGSIYVKDGERIIAEFFGLVASENARLFKQAYLKELVRKLEGSKQ